MEFINIFEQSNTNLVLERLNKLTPSSKPLWGKMNAAQMLAHLNIPYDIDFGKIESKTNFILKLLFKLFLKPTVVGNVPYKKNSRTSPIFMISSERDFEIEKHKLISNIKEVQEKGEKFYEGRESSSFGKMTAKEWSNLFYKHIDHHFKQFGV